MRREDNNWEHAPHMFIECVWEGRQSRGLLFLAEREYAKRELKEVTIRTQLQALALLYVPTSVL